HRALSEHKTLSISWSHYPPHHSLSLEEVVAFFSRKRVAKYKYPEHIVVIEKLPRTASGKIQKFLLRKDIMRRLTQDVCEEIE
uniref:AMP-binding enzyme n=1 Tax=Escherichia coli TaxID=562 RepID=UPI003D18EA1F